MLLLYNTPVTPKGFTQCDLANLQHNYSIMQYPITLFLSTCANTRIIRHNYTPKARKPRARAPF